MSELESGVTSSRNRIFELFTKLFPVASDILVALQAYMGHLLDTKVCLQGMMKETDDTIEELEESQEEVGKAKELMDLAQEQMETEETKTEQRMLAEQQHVSNDADDDGVRNRAEPDHSEVTVGEAQPMISCNTDHQLGRADDDEETHALSEELPPREHVEEQSDHGGSLEAADDLQTATIVRRDRLQAVQSQQDKLAQALEEIKREIKANKEILELQRTQILEIQREYRTAKQEEENNSWSSWCVIF
jgi:chromosome segregation ATPase